MAGGTIELRKAGSSGSWSGLATSLENQNLVARVPDDVAPGRYEFRATITDRAGNTGVTDRRADGSSMVEELPLKEAVQLSAAVNGVGAEPDEGKKCKDKKARKCKCKKRGKGKCKDKSSRAEVTTVRVPYGRTMTLSGVLRTMDDEPVAGRQLTVSERMGVGSDPANRTGTTETNAYGAYELELKAGPSRSVTVTYEGDSHYQRTESAPVDVAVKGKVLSFRSPKTVPETKAIKFRGQIGTMGAELGPQGKRVELEYQKGRNWKTIDTGQSNAGGSFKLRYGLRADYLRKTKVRFRIAVPPEGAWPYAGTATSRARKTIILP